MSDPGSPCYQSRDQAALVAGLSGGGSSGPRCLSGQRRAAATADPDLYRVLLNKVLTRQADIISTEDLRILSRESLEL